MLKNIFRPGSQSAGAKAALTFVTWWVLLLLPQLLIYWGIRLGACLRASPTVLEGNERRGDGDLGWPQSERCPWADHNLERGRRGMNHNPEVTHAAKRWCAINHGQGGWCSEEKGKKYFFPSQRKEFDRRWITVKGQVLQLSYFWNYLGKGLLMPFYYRLHGRFCIAKRGRQKKSWQSGLIDFKTIFSWNARSLELMVVCVCVGGG